MNIYVGNLSRDAEEKDLQEAFEAFGEVKSVSIIKDKFTGEARGFGFVEMPNDSEAKAAIEGLNDQEIKGRPIKVNEARPKTDTRSGGSRGGFGGGSSRGGFGGSRGGSSRGGDRGGFGGNREKRSW